MIDTDNVKTLLNGVYGKNHNQYIMGREFTQEIENMINAEVKYNGYSYSAYVIADVAFIPLWDCCQVVHVVNIKKLPNEYPSKLNKILDELQNTINDLRGLCNEKN